MTIVFLLRTQKMNINSGEMMDKVKTPNEERHKRELGKNGHTQIRCT
jgi:hypothetical protein